MESLYLHTTYINITQKIRLIHLGIKEYLEEESEINELFDLIQEEFLDSIIYNHPEIYDKNDIDLSLTIENLDHILNIIEINYDKF